MTKNNYDLNEVFEASELDRIKMTENWLEYDPKIFTTKAKKTK